MTLPFRSETKTSSVEIKTHEFQEYIGKNAFQKSFGIFIQGGERGGLETCRTTSSIYLSDSYLLHLLK